MPWCLVCARAFKGSYLQIPTVQARIEEGNALSQEQVVPFKMQFPMGKEPLLQRAVTQTMVSLPVEMTAPTGQKVVQEVLQPAWVCWSHLSGLIMKEGGILGYAENALPDMRGAVPLGQRRRPT